MRTSTTVRFAHCKYGHPLAIDSYPVDRWTGIVAGGRAHDLDFRVRCDRAPELAVE